MSFVPALLLVAAQSAPAVAADLVGLPLTGVEAEEFLRTAEIVEVEQFESKGITKPRKVVLSDGERTCEAVFKDIDITHAKTKLTTGKTILGLKDSYKHEIAAYELDQLLGLGMIPPSVQRKVGHQVGSLTLWVYGSMTEWHRMRVYKLDPPDPERWNDQMYTVRLVNQLTNDADYNNISNVLIDDNWRIYKIDLSRAFHANSKLRSPKSLKRMPRDVVEALRDLDRTEFDEALGPWIDRKPLEALWKRRAEIVKLADKLVAKHGEAAVLY